ncbi:MAG: hypothetical protein WCE62_08410 [Polyangiales bacterium]
MVSPEEIDLSELRRQLEERLRGAEPAGYVPGKGILRCAVVEILGCSEMEAEQLVDTLEGRNLIRYQGHSRDEVDDLESHWQLTDE